MSNAFYLFIAVILITAIPAFAQTSQPAPDNAAAQEFENKAINFDPASVRAAAGQHAPGLPASNVGSNDLSRMFLALVAVIAVIFLLRWVARRMSLVPGSVKSGAVKVISRSTVSPRQQVLVLQVGRRLVVVGDSGGIMHPLCEITDPDEVAAMIGSSRHEQAALAAQNPKSFTSAFHRAAEPFDAEARAESAGLGSTSEPLQNIESVSEADNEDVGSLLAKVQVLRQQFRQTRS